MFELHFQVSNMLLRRFNVVCSFVDSMSTAAAVTVVAVADVFASGRCSVIRAHTIAVRRHGFQLLGCLLYTKKKDDAVNPFDYSENLGNLSRILDDCIQSRVKLERGR